MLMRKTNCLLLISTLIVFPGCSMRRANFTAGQPAICELHQTHMSKTNVPIEYGLIRLNDYGRALEAARTNSFPHAKVAVLGGCIVDTPTRAVIYICPQCMIARQEWESKHASLRNVPPEFMTDEWIGFSTADGNTLYNLVLRADRTGFLREVYTVSTSEETLRFEISKWDTGPKIVTCAFRQDDIHGPLKMTCRVTRDARGDSLEATLQNGEGGWKQNIFFWRASKLNEKLKALGK